MTDFDLAIVGGGINGCGIARDAAGRGLKVLLCEKGDVGSSTSSASTKLIHGGLRYLEHGELRLVRESLVERERLLCMAPHLIRPMRFVLPHVPGMRPAWLIRLGLFLYDHIGGRRVLSPTRAVRLNADAVGEPLAPGPTTAYEYSDCWVDDARLVVLNALDAAERGADIRTHTRYASARREGGVWRLQLEAKDGGGESITARALVNSAGLWAAEVRAAALPDEGREGRDAPVRLVQGSHIVVPKMFDGEWSYILQNLDRRVVFAIPFAEEYTLVGTTEREYKGDRDKVEITEAEVDYLLRVINRYFKSRRSRRDVVWSYSGVRALFDDGAENASAVTRDYVLSLEQLQQGGPPLLNVFSGKITTYRKLAEAALERLAPFFPGLKGAWTGTVALPGGDLAVDGVAGLAARLCTMCGGLDEAQALRMAHAYGTRAFEIIGDAKTPDELGEHFGAGLYACEVAWMIRCEWAQTIEDVLWRRSKLGLSLDDSSTERLARWIEQHRAAPLRDNVMTRAPLARAVVPEDGYAPRAARSAAGA